VNQGEDELEVNDGIKILFLSPEFLGQNIV
jgi:hypothetical protein